MLCSLMCENQYMPPVVSTPPASMNGRAPTRLISWETIPDISTMVTAKGRKATPDRRAL